VLCDHVISLYCNAFKDAQRSDSDSSWVVALLAAGVTYVLAAEREGEGLDAHVILQRRACGLFHMPNALNAKSARSSLSSTIEHVTAMLGSALGWTQEQVFELVLPRGSRGRMPGMVAKNILRAPACHTILYSFALPTSAQADPSRGVALRESFSNDSYLAVVYNRLRCSHCGLVPPDPISKPFAYCALCRDPACGRFCSKRPCFEAFWRAGHRDTCAGRDKGKGDKKAGKGK
jgi:hypothetical protein